MRNWEAGWNGQTQRPNLESLGQQQPPMLRVGACCLSLEATALGLRVGPTQAASDEDPLLCATHTA